MSGSVTTESLRQEIEAFEGELSWANGCWFVFRKLFMSDRADVAQRNVSARHFFGLFEKLLMHEIISSLCRLTDPPTTGRHTNLTFERLLGMYTHWEGKDARAAQHVSEDELKEAVSAIRSDMGAAREMRNEKLSHQDLSKARDNAQWQIPLPHIAAVFEALNTYTTYMRVPLFDGVQLEYMDDTCRKAPGEILSLLRDRPQAA